MKRTRIRNLLIAACLVSWIVTAIDPYDPEAWALEQIAGLLCIGCFVWSTHSTSYSISCWVGLAILFIFHTIGTHFTYSLTPYDAFFQNITGSTLNDILGWERNHYDRFVHFVFGLATIRIFYEFLLQREHDNSPMTWFLAFNLVISASALYELMEWAAALMFANEAGTLYLGTQGDIWDAQVDIFLAGLGAILSITAYQLPAAMRKLRARTYRSEFEC